MKPLPNLEIHKVFGVQSVAELEGLLEEGLEDHITPVNVELSKSEYNDPNKRERDQDPEETTLPALETLEEGTEIK